MRYWLFYMFWFVRLMAFPFIRCDQIIPQFYNTRCFFFSFFFFFFFYNLSCCNRTSKRHINQISKCGVQQNIRNTFLTNRILVWHTYRISIRAMMDICPSVIFRDISLNFYNPVFQKIQETGDHNKTGRQKQRERSYVAIASNRQFQLYPTIL